MNIHDLMERLEPQQSTTADASPEEDLQLMSITSIAVSLKRIADALDSKSPKGSMLHWLEQIAHATELACGR